MRLNKISRVIRKVNITPPNKTAFFSSILLTMLMAPSYAAENEVANNVESQKIKQNTDDGRSIKVKNTKGEVEVIEVRGMRGTLTRSLNEKKNTVAIVDAIASADFGDLPGLSLSDVIENISGASGHRLKGSQNEISIRGLGSYWGYSTFNGRTITNAGPGRAVNFKKFPSDLVDKVVIYKSQQADLVEGGTSGTIDVNSLRPVDFGKSKTTVEASGIYNSYYKDSNSSPWGNKFVLSTVQNWETDSLGDMGFTFGVSHSNTANPEENYGGSSQMGVCATKFADGTAIDQGDDCVKSAGGISAGRIGKTPRTDAEGFDLSKWDADSIYYVPNDAYWRTGEDEDKRTNIVGTFQWTLNDQWDFNLDWEYSKLEYTEKRMELALDSRRRNLTNHIIQDRTLLYVEGEAKPYLQGENRNQVDDYDGYGVNVAYTPSDNLTMAVDLSYSKSYRYRLRHRTKFKAEDYQAYSLDFRDRNVPELTFLDGFDASDMNSFIRNDQGWTDAEYRRSNDERTDDIWAAKFDVEYTLDNDYFSAIKAGIRYSSEHLLDETSTDVSISPVTGAQGTSAWKTGSDGYEGSPEHIAFTSAVMENCQNGHYNDHLFDEETGAAGDAANFATYDSKCFIGELFGSVSGDSTFFDIGERDDKRSGGDRDVTEDITAVYFMADLNTEVGGYPVYGNVGIRGVKTDTHSDGWGEKVYITTNADGTYSAAINPTGEIEAVTLDSSYTRYLPSMNVTVQLDDAWYVKTAVYRAMSRFQLNAMASGIEFTRCEDVSDETECDENTNTDYTQVIQSADASGNHMKPYMSTNYDLSIEWYPSLDAAVTLALYHKDFIGGYVATVENRDVTVSLDGVDTIFPNVATSTRDTSDDSSTIKGFEFTAQKSFVELPEPFNGLGAKIAYNHAISDFVTEEVGSPGVVPDANLFGFSEDVASGSVYWEGDKLSLRIMYKYRSKYFQPNGLPFPDRSNRYVQDSDYLDFAAKYKLTKNVSVSLKALNLLNEPQVYTRGNDTTIADYSRTGAKFFLGVKAKF